MELEMPTSDVQILGLNCFACIVFYVAMRILQMVGGMPKTYNKAWFLTLYSSIVTSAAGTYYFGRVVTEGFGPIFEEAETPLSRHLALFFLSYCIMDILIANVEYVDQLDWESGIGHHVLYMVVISYLLWQSSTAYFCVFLIEELPTVYLSVKRLQQRTELRWKFAFSYFLTRVLFHSVAAYAMLDFSLLGFLGGLTILRFHMQWFGRWWKKHEQFLANKKKGSVQLTLRQKLQILMCMVVVQVGTHMYCTTWAEPLQWMGLTSLWHNLLHCSAFIYFSFQMVSVLQNTYSDSFIMDAIGSKNIIYNISWEDPRVERKCCKFTKDDVILTISSAGCNVLDYLCDDPKAIVAADLNEAQLALLDLKLACIESGMPHEDFFALWGRSDPEVFRKYYKSTVRELLRRESSKEFWDNNGSLFDSNLMFAGSSGLMAYFLMVICKIAGIDKNMHRKLPIDPKKSWFLMFAAWVISQPWMWEWLAPLGGVPHAQLSLLSRQPELFSERLIEILATRMWSKDNYFYHGYITGVFAKDCCPRYMSAEHYPHLKQRVQNVSLHHGLLGEAAKKRKDWTVISLLDSMDWMSFEMVAGLVYDIVPYVDKAKCRIFWRSFAPDTEVHSPVLAQLLPDLVPDYDRVGWYLSQWECKVPDNFDVNMIKLDIQGPQTVYKNSALDDVMVMGAMALHALRKKKDVAAFYRSQGKRYDGFREALLPDRDSLMQYGIPWTQPIDIWVSVGCGTARDLEFVVDKLRKRPKLKVYLLDLSAELLIVAKERVERLGLSKRVTVVQGDVTDAQFLQSQPFYGKCDLVTCSYCLTMIPNWQPALKAMHDMLRLGGFMGMVDFTMRARREERMDQRFYRWWFSNDGVYFDRQHVDWLQANLKLVWYYENSSRVPYTCLYPSHYVFVGRKVAATQS